MSKKLTDRQERFAREYVLDLNATRSAKDAGCPEKSASVQGSKWLAIPKVAARVQELMAAREKRTDINADRVLRELGHLAFSDITQIVSGGGGKTLEVESLEDLPEDVRRCIAEVSETRDGEGGGTIKVKLHSKPTALRMIMDHLGMDAPKRIAGADGGPVQVSVVQVTPEEAEAALVRAGWRKS